MTCSANPSRSISAPCTWGKVRRPNGSWIRAGSASGPISSRIVRHTHRDPGNGVATSTAGLNASALPRTAAKSIAATTTALRASRSRSATARAASARTAALLDMKVSASPGPKLGGGGDRRRAGPLAAQHQGGGREGGQVRRADAASLAHRRQRVGGDHRVQRVEHGRVDAVAVGGQLVEPDHQHRAHPLGGAELRPSWWRASAAAGAPGSRGPAGPGRGWRPPRSSGRRSGAARRPCRRTRATRRRARARPGRPPPARRGGTTATISSRERWLPSRIGTADSSRRDPSGPRHLRSLPDRGRWCNSLSQRQRAAAQ